MAVDIDNQKQINTRLLTIISTVFIEIFFFSFTELTVFNDWTSINLINIIVVFSFQILLRLFNLLFFTYLFTTTFLFRIGLTKQLNGEFILYFMLIICTLVYIGERAIVFISFLGNSNNAFIQLDSQIYFYILFPISNFLQIYFYILIMTYSFKINSLYFHDSEIWLNKL